VPQPLEGYRVIDMTEVWAGPMGTTYLGDLGSEVIRLESYPRASMTRPVQAMAGNVANLQAIPTDATRPWDYSTTYHLPNRNKLGIALNVMHPRGRPLFEKLVSLSDVFVIGYSAGTVARMRVDYETLSRINPRLVMVTMPGWGERGPYQGYATLGSGLDAFSGHFYLRGYPNDDPTSTPTGVFHSDATGAAALAFAVMTALHYRERTGKGQYIDLSQAEVLLTHLARPALDWSMNGRVQEPRGNADPSACPHGCFPGKDEGSWVTIAARTDEDWQALVRAMGSPEWAKDRRLASLLGRRAERPRVESGVADWTRTLSQSEVIERLRSAGVPCGPVYDIPSLLGDPQLSERGFWVESNHPPAPTYKRGNVLWRMNATPSEFKIPTNNLGEHNREVLCGLLGVSDTDFEELTSEAVIGDVYLPGAEVDSD
jgi:crotonobetainyl-CoA:carnitine CoA-transferase CaiB-like acyl-CoA transferase